MQAGKCLWMNHSRRQMSQLRKVDYKGPKWKGVDLQRPEEKCDLLIVGAGPSGLSAAIRFKQLKPDARICVLEKGHEPGAHILSGAVLEPHSLQRLLPDFIAKNTSLFTKVTKDAFYILTKKRAIPVPLPPKSFLDNKGNYIIRLGHLVKQLSVEAEKLGVEIYPSCAGEEVLFDIKNNSVQGVATNDIGVDKNGNPKNYFSRGISFTAPNTIFSEGCRGHLTKEIIQKFDLYSGGGTSKFMSYAIGFKELWRVQKAKHFPGRVVHTMGWPTDLRTYSGSFIYHIDSGPDDDDSLVVVGIVIGLDYKNPHLNPYKEFQKLKTHPMVRGILESGKRIAYGARALNEGGYQGIPKVEFPGGKIIGCSAGFLNVSKVKGIHNAIESGIICAESIHEGKSYQETLNNSSIIRELYGSRNVRPSFNSKLGWLGGLLYSGVFGYGLKGKEPWTLKFKTPDHLATHKINEREAKLLKYDPPDGKLTFDLLSSVQLTGTNHPENQPCHLLLKDPKRHLEYNLPQYDGLEKLYCPAGVYEYVDDEQGEKKFQINSQNCIHCKTCDIKDPSQNIKWVNPEGGGPAYNGM